MIWLDRSLLISPVYYGLCKTEKDFKKELKRLGINKKEWPEFIKNDQSDATFHHFDNTSTNNSCCIVCIRVTKDVSKIQVYSLLVHEAVHIWQEIRETIGERCPATEQEAYAIQAISQQLFTAYNEK